MLDIKNILNQPNTKIGEIINGFSVGEKASVFSLTARDSAILACALDSCVYVAADVIAAYSAYDTIKAFRRDCVFLSAKDSLLMPEVNEMNSSAFSRYKSLYSIASGKAKIVVTTPDALMQIYPLPQSVVKGAVKFAVGEQVDMVQAVSYLVAMGYRRETHLSEGATFTVRGGIIDIWLPDGDIVRVDFFGDTVETVKRLNLDLSPKESIACIDVYPAREVYYTLEQGQAAIKALTIDRDKISKTVPSAGKAHDDLIMSIQNGRGNIICSAPLFPHVTLNEFCNMPIVIEDAKKCYDNAYFAVREHSARFKRLYAAAESPFCAVDNLLTCHNDLNMRLCFHRFDSQNRFFTPNKLYNLNSISIKGYMGNLPALARDIKAWQSRNIKVYVGASVDEALHPLDCFGYTFEGEFPFGGVFFDCNTVFVGRGDIFKSHETVPVKRHKALKELPAVGDYVVHENCGVGMVQRIGAEKVGTTSRDYVVVKYRGDDKLFIPVENISSLSKYDMGEETPALNRLGGGEFERVKAKVKSEIKKSTMNLLSLYSTRALQKSRKFSSDDSLLDEFSAAFAYEETPDQLSAVVDALKDLRSGKIMDRLICGDVGFGKTEVALRVAFKVISEGAQVAFMSPTTVLCRQHYATATARMQPFGVKVRALNRFSEDANEVKRGLKDGTVDMVVGTHRLLSGDIEFKDLQLLILDEEQKFGVEHKEKIKALKKDVNVISLSATPIPRTLHMALSGIRDVSMLETPPVGRLPAQVYIAEYSDALCADAAERELNRGGQVFIVYNFVHASSKTSVSIEEFAARIRALLPKARIVYAHGQMNKEQLERAVDTFADGKADILIATTIIENGIDIPRANTMIVYGAERMGLAQMYQLKGRVGRNDRVAQVYFTYRQDSNLTEAAVKRLEAMNEFTELGSGVKVAEADMRLRGVGNVFGVQQHGHIYKVGYDLYCKLLAQTVKEIKGEDSTANLTQQARVEFDGDAFIPTEYCDQAMRMTLYRKISELSSEEEFNRFIADTADTFTVVPDSVRNLAKVGMIKNLATRIQSTRVFINDTVRLEFSDTKSIPHCFMDFNGRLDASGNKPSIVFPSLDIAVNFLSAANK